MRSPDERWCAGQARQVRRDPDYPHHHVQFFEVSPWNRLRITDDPGKCSVTGRLVDAYSAYANSRQVQVP
jgi:hypothetical protein